MLQDVADDFVENVAAFACELAVHRGGATLEAKDIQLALGARERLPRVRWVSVLQPPGGLAQQCERARVSSSSSPRVLLLPLTTPPRGCAVALAEKNWNMRLVGVGDHTAGEMKIIKKTNVTDAHKTRLADVRRSKQLSHR